MIDGVVTNWSRLGVQMWMLCEVLCQAELVWIVNSET